MLTFTTSNSCKNCPAVVQPTEMLLSVSKLDLAATINLHQATTSSHGNVVPQMLLLLGPTAEATILDHHHPGLLAVHHGNKEAEAMTMATRTGTAAAIMPLLRQAALLHGPSQTKHHPLLLTHLLNPGAMVATKHLATAILPHSRWVLPQDSASLVHQPLELPLDSILLLFCNKWLAILRHHLHLTHLLLRHHLLAPLHHLHHLQEIRLRTTNSRMTEIARSNMDGLMFVEGFTRFQFGSRMRFALR